MCERKLRGGEKVTLDPRDMYADYRDIALECRKHLLVAAHRRDGALTSDDLDSRFTGASSRTMCSHREMGSTPSPNPPLAVREPGILQ
jgi:hypothetical protein